MEKKLTQFRKIDNQELNDKNAQIDKIIETNQIYLS